MHRYVEIAVNVPQVSGAFHYQLPERLEGRATTGQLVLVPFGRQTVQGVIIGFVDKPDIENTKEVIDLVDPNAVLTESQIKFATHLAETTLSSLASCIELMLPPGLAKRADTLYRPQVSGFSGELSEPQKRLLNLLHKRGPLRSQQIDRSLSRMDWRSAAQALIRKGLLMTESVLPAPTIRPKFIRTAQLACPPSIAEQSLPNLGKSIQTVRLNCSPEEAFAKMDLLASQGSKTLSRRQKALEYLINHLDTIDLPTLTKKTGVNAGDIQKLIELKLVSIGSIPSPVLKRRQEMLQFLIRETEPVDVTWLYAESGGKLEDLYYLSNQGLVVLRESEVWRDPVESIRYQITEPPPLTKDQLSVWMVVKEAIQLNRTNKATRPILLHGVTGSGKTEIYLHAVDETLTNGKQVIILVPEIALTAQTIRRFAGRFPGQVGLLHSGLSQGERYDTWRRARMGEFSVVVGPRSALFTPFNNLGLIVVDECHDDTYYQVDPEPHYHARDAAILYARLTGAVCLLGSATPDVDTYFHTDKSNKIHLKDSYRYVSLPSRIIAHHAEAQAQVDHIRSKSKDIHDITSIFQPYEGQADSKDLPPVNVVDMRRELQIGNRSIFSTELQEALKLVLASDQQAILFLNRRGTATYIFCRDCGYTLKCPRCEVPLTYHSPREALLCHHCGYTRKNPTSCPSCSSTRIRYYGTGTQRVEEQVHAHFPEARTLRWDYETTRKKGAHDLILSHFSAHRADILIGTQMLAKGLDLPLVTLVGIILADVGINLPDFRASERTFQILTQVAGRAGRSPLGGKVVLQTFQPDHYVIQAAADHNYEEFYNQEILYRRKLGYPPFSELVRLEYRDPKPNRAENAAMSMAANVNQWIEEESRRTTSMIGPVPCFFSPVGSFHRWQIILRGPNPSALLRGRPLGKWKVSVNPPNLL